MRKIRKQSVLFNPVFFIICLNTAIYLLQVILQNPMGYSTLIYNFALIPELVLQGKYWQIFTYGFLHESTGLISLHLILNMYAVYWLGGIVISKIGKIKFLILYFSAQMGGGILVFLFSLLSLFQVIPSSEVNLMTTPTIGASGAVFGLLAVFGLIHPETIVFLLFFRIKAKNAVIVALIIGFVLEIFLNVRISNMGHLGGAIVGYIFFYLEWNRTIEKKKVKTGLEAERVQDIDIVHNFENQKKKNMDLLSKLDKIENIKEKNQFLLSHFVENANICPPSSYNSSDEFCLRCEWLPNCEGRKSKS